MSARAARGFLLILLASAVSCSRSAPAASAAPPPDYVACRDPRPEICTRDYRPVCALRDTGIRCVTTPCDSSEWVTASNACTACSDPKVLGYRPQACPE